MQHSHTQKFRTDSANMHHRCNLWSKKGNKINSTLWKLTQMLKKYKYNCLAYIFWCSTLDTSSLLCPGFIGCFGSCNRHLLPGDPTGVQQAPACDQVANYVSHFSPLFSHSYLKAFFTASLMVLIADLLLCPGFHRPFWASANPQQQTTTGVHLVLHPFLQQSPTISWYYALSLSCASSILSSQATVSSKRINFLVDLDTRMMSSLKEDWIM